MTRLGLLSVLLLAAASSAGAQPPQAAPARAASAAHRAVPASYRITIGFRRSVHGKLRADKTYTLLATAGETLPAIRDDARFRTDANCSDPACSITGATDVDILVFKPHGPVITVGLKISMQTIGMEPPDYLPKLPVAGTHQYLVTPTVPFGKRITVYTANDASYSTTVEVQLLVEPFDPGKSAVQP